MFIISLGSNKGETVQLKQNFEFGRPYNEIGPTNHRTHTDIDLINHWGCLQ